MTARRLAKELGRGASVLTSGKESFVVMPMAEYRRLCEAYEDAMDLLALEHARAENAGDKRIPWESVRHKYIKRAKPASRKSKIRTVR